jgi:ribosomal subunit interface protein
MRIQVSARRLDTSGRLRTHAERRLRSKLERFSSRIIDAPVTITKLNRSDRRSDTRCRIQVRIRGHTQIVVEGVGKNPYIAVDRAADKVRRAVVRKLDRARDSRRGNVVP